VSSTAAQATFERRRDGVEDALRDRPHSGTSSASVWESSRLAADRALASRGGRGAWTQSRYALERTCAPRRRRATAGARSRSPPAARPRPARRPPRASASVHAQNSSDDRLPGARRARAGSARDERHRRRAGNAVAGVEITSAPPNPQRGKEPGCGTAPRSTTRSVARSSTVLPGVRLHVLQPRGAATAGEEAGLDIAPRLPTLERAVAEHHHAFVARTSKGRTSRW
jgi:hypothetical protein